MFRFCLFDSFCEKIPCHWITGSTCVRKCRVTVSCTFVEVDYIQGTSDCQSWGSELLTWINLDIYIYRYKIRRKGWITKFWSINIYRLRSRVCVAFSHRENTRVFSCQIVLFVVKHTTHSTDEESTDQFIHWQPVFLFAGDSENRDFSAKVSLPFTCHNLLSKEQVK